MMFQTFLEDRLRSPKRHCQPFSGSVWRISEPAPRSNFSDSSEAINQALEKDKWRDKNVIELCKLLQQRRNVSELDEKFGNFVVA